MIQINDKSFEAFITKEEIESAIKGIAAAIELDYSNEEILFVAVLNGSFMFASDLLKNVKSDCAISFVKISSYLGTASTGHVQEIIGLNASLKGKHVIILEDIVDTGRTIDKIVENFEREEPTTLKICTLLYKEEAFQGKNVPHYYGFKIPNRFVVGYGLDYNEKGRNLSAIYQLKKQ